MNLDDIKDRALRCEEARDAGEGTVGAYGWAAAAIASAADVPLLVQEIERLRALVDALNVDAGDYQIISETIGPLTRDGWDDDAAEVQIIVDWAKHMDRMHPDCPGRWCGEATAEPAERREWGAC